MKRSILTLAVSVLFAISVIKVNAHTEKETPDVKSRMQTAMKDSSDYQKFKRDAEAKIKKNEKSIADLKAKKTSENKETQDRYNKKVAAIEQKNNNLKKQIANQKEENDKAKWNAFKKDFNKSMDDLGESMKDLMNSK